MSTATNTLAHRAAHSFAGLSLRAACASLALFSAFQAPQAAAQSMPACTGSSPGGEYVAQRVWTNPRPEEGLHEGPVWTNGALYFSDFIFDEPNNFPSRILKLSSDGSVSTVIENSGSNGIAVDGAGNLVTANHGVSGIVRINPVTGVRNTLVSSYNGAKFNSPNDLTIGASGTIYFTDPSWQRQNSNPGQPTTNVYRLAPNGSVSVVDNTIQNPNGISLSPAGDKLYVATGTGAIKVYPIVNGVPGAGSNFFTGLDGADGMVVDCKGNLFVTEHGKNQIRVINPAGQAIALIRVDANVTNVAFGEYDRRTLYITGKKAVWKLQLSAPGYPY